MKRRFIIKNLFFWQGTFSYVIISNILPAMRCWDFPDRERFIQRGYVYRMAVASG